MNQLKLALLLLLLASMWAGCARTEKRTVTQGDLQSPYASLGTLEVNIKTNPWHPVHWGSYLKEIFTLTFADTSLQSKLTHKLLKKSKGFGANQIIKAEFWPDLKSKRFPEGKAYARGEMVRPKRFEN